MTEPTFDYICRKLDEAYEIQGQLIDACGLALNYHQEDHVHEALQAAIARAVDNADDRSET